MRIGAWLTAGAKVLRRLFVSSIGKWRAFVAGGPVGTTRALTLLLLAACASAPDAARDGAVERSGNPLFPGWYADPEVAVFGDRYWIYPTFSAPYDEQTFFDAFSSPDLVHWQKHERVLQRADVSWAKRAIWAPAIVARDGRYYFFFAANDIQDDTQLGGIGVAVADEPAGPFRDYLGKPLVDRFHNGAQPIDQFV